MSNSEADRVGSFYNPIVLSDDEFDTESVLESYTSLEVGSRHILRVAIEGDDEMLQEFDRARGQTCKDIYAAFLADLLNDDTDSKDEIEDVDEPSPKRIRRTTRGKEPNYKCVIEDMDDFQDEVFTSEKYKENKDRNHDVSP